MKRKAFLLIALILATGTLSLQVAWSVPEHAEAASASGTRETMHAGSVGQVRHVVNLRKPATKTAPAIVQKKPVVTLAAAVPTPDPLAAIVQSDILPKHQAIARRILSLLPVSCQQKLRQFYVVYNEPANRGLAGNGVIIMNGSLSDSDFAALLLHEGLGHFWDLTCTTGTAAGGTSPFTDGGIPVYQNDPSASFYEISWVKDGKKKPGSTDADFPSGYAAGTDQFEDLAESVVYYLLQPEAFRARALTDEAMARKLAWLEMYFPVQQKLATGSTWTGTVAWDASKTPFTWLAD